MNHLNEHENLIMITISGYCLNGELVYIQNFVKYCNARFINTDGDFIGKSQYYSIEFGENSDYRLYCYLINEYKTHSVYTESYVSNFKKLKNKLIGILKHLY